MTCNLKLVSSGYLQDGCGVYLQVGHCHLNILAVISQLSQDLYWQIRLVLPLLLQTKAGVFAIWTSQACVIASQSRQPCVLADQPNKAYIIGSQPMNARIFSNQPRQACLIAVQLSHTGLIASKAGRLACQAGNFKLG